MTRAPGVSSAALLVSLAPVSTIDVGYGTRAGQLFLDGAGIQRSDTFTFTAAGLPWVNRQWLGQVLIAAGYRAGGWAAAVALSVPATPRLLVYMFMMFLADLRRRPAGDG